MEYAQVRKHISNVFKLNGLSIRSDGVKYLYELLLPLNIDDRDLWIDKVIESVQNLSLSASVIGSSEIKKAAEDLHSAENEELEVVIQVIDAYKIPKLNYNVERKKFIIDQKFSPSLHGNADDKTILFRNRYSTVYQRTCNHELFQTSEFKMLQDSEQKFGLVKTEYLLSLGTMKKDLVVLGMLTRITEGEFHLEDDTGMIKVDLSKSKFHNGLFTLNCFVLIEGWFEDGILHCSAVGFPPVEPPKTSRALLGNINYFGGSTEVSPKYNQSLLKLEADNKEAMIVILADVWLDKIEVIEKIQTMFEGYAQCPPVAFIFCGNFLSGTIGSQQVSELIGAFSNLASIIKSFPSLVNQSRFVFVPGPNDPGPGNIFPRPRLSTYITAEFTRVVPNSNFTSNPCRLMYCTKEIVVFREDVFTKMCRNCVFFPTDATNIPNHFARTIISQAHLVPLPLHTIPIYWGYDHALALHPTPDLIITADKGDAFSTSYNSCLVVNPGSFAKTNFSFKVYMPAEHNIEDSQIAD